MRPDPALVAALVTEILPQGLAVAAGDPTVMPDCIDPDEDRAVRGAVPRRVVEFHAGRAAARAAMQVLGAPGQSILVAQDRAPVWPDGLTGSISHSSTACVAAVGKASDWRGIGVDLEEATALDPLLIGEVCTKAERRWLGQQPEAERGLMAKLIFSAKEAAYKAQYTQSRRLFGFDALEVSIDRHTSRFKAQFCAPQEPFAAGDFLHGSYAHAAGLLVTGVAIRHSGQADVSNG